jgi:hypothetical protein
LFRVLCVVRDLCDELITRLEESYRLRCVVVCDLQTSRMRRPWPELGQSAIRRERKKKNYTYCTSGTMNVLVLTAPEPRLIQSEAYLGFWREGVSNHNGHPKQKLRIKKITFLEFISIYFYNLKSFKRRKYFYFHFKYSDTSANEDNSFRNHFR